LVDSEAPTVEHERVRSGEERRDVATPVAGVAGGELAPDLLDVGAELASAPVRALVLAGRQENLDLRFGGDDGADVTALGDPVPRVKQRALGREQRGADLRERRDPRGLGGDGRAADLAGHVAAAKEDALAE